MAYSIASLWESKSSALHEPVAIRLQKDIEIAISSLEKERRESNLLDQQIKQAQDEL